MSPILTISNATKRYNTPDGTIITALDGVSLVVNENEFVTLLGPSGCGKTTLLRTISGFEDLEEGSIHIDGSDITGLPAHKRPVNTVFQKYALFPHMTIAKNVAYSLEVSGMKKQQVSERVDRILELVGLRDFGDRKVTQLSGGQQQRVALARSLVAQPKILLLDEPLSALDKNLRHKMQQELKQLQEEIGITFVFVTHDQEEALTMSDRIVVLNNGKIQQLGTPEDLYRRPENEFVARFVGEGNLFQAEVIATNGHELQLRLAGGQTTVASHAALPIGHKVKLLARPEDMGLGRGDEHHDLNFDGIVDQVFFVGTDYQILATSEEGAPLKATIRPDARREIASPVPGSAISMHIPSCALHLITAATAA